MSLTKHCISFCNKFNKLNNTGEKMLDSINHYHMTFEYFEIAFCIKIYFCHCIRNDGIKSIE